MKEKNKRNTILVAILLLLLVVVGYATLTTKLNINGTTTIKNNDFSVIFTNVVEKEGSVTAKTPAKIDGDGSTSLSFDADLESPGDYYGFSVDVENTGQLDAMIESITVTQLTKTQQEYLTFTLEDEKGNNISTKELLKKGNKRTIKVMLMYKTTPTTYPGTSSESITIEIKINYVEADETAVEVTESEEGMLIGNKFEATTSSTYAALNRITNPKNVYLTAGTKISLKNPTTYKMAIVTQQTSEEITRSGTYANGGWSTADFVIETDNWYGIIFARNDNENFALGTTDPNTLLDYITIS